MRKALHILGILSDGDIDWMAEHGRLQHTTAGEMLIQVNRPIPDLLFLLDGQLSVRVGPESAMEIARLLPGEVVGEISFVDSRPPSASVFALQPSCLLAIPRTTLSAKLDKDGMFAARFYRAIASFLADRLYVTVGRFGYGSAQQDADKTDLDLIEDDAMESVSLAAVRFDKLVKHLRGANRAASFVAV